MPHPVSQESVSGLVDTALMVGFPAAVASYPPLFCPSTPEKTHPLRLIEVAGIDNFFDHSGNCINGTASAAVLIAAGMVVGKFVPESKRTAVILGTAGLAAVGSVGINVAYEAGAHVPLYPQKKSEFDGQDALFGGITGVLFSTVFVVAALRKKFQNNK